MPEYRDQVIGDCFGPDNQDSVLSYSMTTSGARALLLWSRQQTEGYHDVNIYNMTSSWRDGLAFCAIIHRYRPDLIDFDKLSKDNIVQNNELAFDICERLLDIPSILDVRDMAEKSMPDKLSVLTFVSQLFNYFKDKIPANQVASTKMNASIKSKNEMSLAGKGKRATNQIYSLHGKAKRFSSALKNVFKSDAKDDRLKVDDSLTKQSSHENLKLVCDTEKKSDTSTTTVPRQPKIGTTCFVCHGKVFILERLVVEHKLFHRACLKCTKCGSGLRPGTYTYCSDAETFSCIYECMADFKKTQEEIRIKLQPITDKVFDVLDKAHQAQNTSRKSSGTQGNTLGPPFSIIKKNTISIGSLDKSFEDLSNHKRKHRRLSKQRKQSKGRENRGVPRESNKSNSDNALTPTSGTTKIEVEVKHENGKVKSCVRIQSMKTKQSTPVQSNDVTNENSDEEDTSKLIPGWKEKAKGPVGLNDAYNRDQEEKPQEGSVNKLRMKFMNIDNIIEDKHRQKVAKKNERIQREIRRVVPTWTEGANGVDENIEKEQTPLDVESRKSLESESSGSLGTSNSSGQSSSSSQMSGQNSIVVSVSSSQNANKSTEKNSNLSAPTEDSSSSTCSTPSPTGRTIPIIVKPSLESDNERERSCSQTSSPGVLSPLSDSSLSESPNSPMTSPMENHWSSQNSLSVEANNLPKMSIIIAQEASSTKISSRYFTVETCESKDRNVIIEEKEEETVDIEGEFRFGDDEGNKFTKAQHDVLTSLNNCSITRDKSEAFKEEEVFVSPLEIIDELNALGTLLSELEKRGVNMEKLLRCSMTSDRSLDNEDELVREWLTLVQEKNVILRRESELIYLIKFHQYEDRYLLVECELRALLSLKDEQKTLESTKKERQLMAELFNLVQRRTSIVDKLEEDQERERQEEESTKHAIDDDGPGETTEETWVQIKQQDYTKVAFSRFYC